MFLMITSVRKMLVESVHLSEFKIQRLCASLPTLHAEKSQLNVCTWTFVYSLLLAYIGAFCMYV